MLLAIACALILNLSLRLPAWLNPREPVIAWLNQLEARFNAPPGRAWRSHGFSAWLLVVLPFVGVLWLLAAIPYVGWLLDVLVLCWALDLGLLKTRVFNLIEQLRFAELNQTQAALAPVVAQQTHNLDRQALTRAAVESVIKDGVYTVLAVVFWFALLGPIGAVIYRLSHGLNRFWGHRDLRFIRFGWAAAKIFHGLAFIPARLSAISFALLGNTRQAFACWRRQAHGWPSINAGVILASAAGALNLSLGGPAYYREWSEPRCELGGQGVVTAFSLDQALNLIYQSLLLWLLLIGAWTLCYA